MSEMVIGVDTDDGRSWSTSVEMRRDYAGQNDFKQALCVICGFPGFASRDFIGNVGSKRKPKMVELRRVICVGCKAPWVPSYRDRQPLPSHDPEMRELLVINPPPSGFFLLKRAPS